MKYSDKQIENENIMKKLTNLYGHTIKIKFVYENGHRFHGQVFYYKDGVRSGYRHSIESLNKHLKKEDQIKLPK